VTFISTPRDIGAQSNEFGPHSAPEKLINNSALAHTSHGSVLEKCGVNEFVNKYFPAPQESSAQLDLAYLADSQGHVKYYRHSVVIDVT